MDICRYMIKLLWFRSMNNKIIKFAGLHAFATALYIALVASFLFYIPEMLSGPNTEDTVFIPIFMLLLFVFSAALTGSLVLARPILWYLDGNKKEAVSLLLATVACLFLFTVVAFLGLALFGK